MRDPNDQRYMAMALEACRVGVSEGQSPFAACIVSHAGEVLACEHNHVRADTDPIAHAEVCAIRAACGKVGRVHLPDATIYSTTEPCPMCFAAIHWARIGRIVYGAAIEDAASFGFNELPISNTKMKELGACPVVIDPGFMRAEAVSLFRDWQAQGGEPY